MLPISFEILIIHVCEFSRKPVTSNKKIRINKWIRPLFSLYSVLGLYNRNINKIVIHSSTSKATALITYLSELFIFCRTHWAPRARVYSGDWYPASWSHGCRASCRQSRSRRRAATAICSASCSSYSDTSSSTIRITRLVSVPLNTTDIMKNPNELRSHENQHKISRSFSEAE